MNAVPTLNLPNIVCSEESTENPVPMHQMELQEPQQMNDNCSKREIICRLCSETQKNPIRNQLENLVESEELLQLCLGRGRFLEELPNGVCDQCLKMIKLTGAFIQDCLKAQEKLQKMFLEASQQQMVDSFKDETQGQDKSFGQSFAIPDPAVSLDYADELIIKHELVYASPLDEFDSNDLQDNDAGSDDDHGEEDMSLNLKADEYTGHPIMSGSGFLCTICNRTFTRKGRLKAHIESIHEKRKFTCSICGNNYGWLKGLQRHMKTHVTTPQHTQAKGLVEHTCKRCGKMFNKLDELHSHSNTHKGDKFRCPLCSKYLSRFVTFRKHLMKQHQMSNESASMHAKRAIQC